MRLLDVLFGAVWIAFWLYWVAAAIRSRSLDRGRVWTGAMIGPRLLIGIVVIAALRLHWLTSGGVAISIFPFRLACFVIFLLGLGLAVWARVCLGVQWGQPMTERIEPHLITSGPYAYIRHPIYSGLILAVIGTALSFSLYSLFIAAFLTCYFVYSATVEERNMIRRFPQEYDVYRRSTHMLIPVVF